MANKWDDDGTQDPEPPVVWNDPVAGLVTGAKYEAPTLRVWLAQPEVDMEEVRKAVESQLSGDDDDDDDEPVQARVPRPRQPAAEDTGTPGLLPAKSRSSKERDAEAEEKLRKLRSGQPFLRGSGGVLLIGIVAAVVITVLIYLVITGLADTVRDIVD